MKINVWGLTVQLSVMLVACMLSGCEQKGNFKNLPEYYAVQMSKGDSWSIIDKDGKVVVKEEYPAEAEISNIYDGVFWVKQDDKYQLFSIENPKKPVIDEEFTSVTTFQGGRSAVANPNYPIRIINPKGETVATLSKDIESCMMFTDDGYALVRNHDYKWGLINADGKEVLKTEYFSITILGEGEVLVTKNIDDKKLLIMDTQGKKLGEIDRQKYDMRSYTLSEGKLLVTLKDETNGPTIVLDKTGKKLFEIKKAKSCEGYYDGGYLVIGNGEGKFGIVNDKGEIVIRQKYDGLVNIGNGEFYAKKGDKVGVINASDEAIVEFEYEDWGYIMSTNYMLHDASGYVIVNKEGKELISFEEYGSVMFSSYFAQYVDIDGIVDALVKCIEEYESAETAEQMAKKNNWDIEQAHHAVYCTMNHRIGTQVNAELKVYFDGNVAEEKFHEEKVNDGWFTTTNMVSDGWQWTNVVPNGIDGDIVPSGLGVSTHDFFEQVLGKLEKGREKQPDGTFKKRVKSGGYVIDVLTKLEDDGEKLHLNMLFRKVIK